MIIANPIYDVVFKYLLEDMEIARGFLSKIIGEEIESLTVQPQELLVQKEIPTASQTTELIRILRLDFKAIIRTQTGETKMVLIELQKARKLFDIMRFRTYLGENYKKGEDYVNDKGETETNPLPIIAIYFLGFKLEHIKVAVVKVDRTYKDVYTGQALDASIKESFIENLTHDSYTIQIPLLGEDIKTPLQKVLRVFNQKFKKRDDKHKLDFGENIDDPLVEKMLDRLTRAIASEEILAEMNMEDELEKIFGKLDRDLEAVRKENAENIKALQLKNKVIEEKDKAIEEQNKAIEEERKANEALRKEFEEYKKRFTDNN